MEWLIHCLDRPAFFGTHILESGILTGTSLPLYTLILRLGGKTVLWLVYLPFLSDFKNNSTLILYSVRVALLNCLLHFDMFKGLVFNSYSFFSILNFGALYGWERQTNNVNT